MMTEGRFSVLNHWGRLAQLVRAPALQAGCRGFESLAAHHRLMVLPFSQDFACGLGRPQSGSSSSPSLPTIALWSFLSVRISPAGSDARKAAQVRVPRCPNRLMVLPFSQDFACGLGRPQSGSSSSPSLPTIASSNFVIRNARCSQGRRVPWHCRSVLRKRGLS